MTFRASLEARDWVQTIPRSYGGTLRAMLALRERTRFAEQDLARTIPVDSSVQHRLRVASRALESKHFTMRDAIVESGYRSVHCVVVSCVVLDALNELVPQRLYLPYWRRAAERGVLAILAASTHRAHWDSAFTAGFVCEIGDLLREMYEETQRLQATAAEPEGRPVAAGPDFASNDLGFVLAEHWRLPAEIREAVGGPSAADGGPSIRALIETADRVMAQLAAGESTSERTEDEMVMRRLEVIGGREWLDRSAHRLISLAFVDDRLTEVA